MKTLRNYIAEKLIIYHQQVDEKLVINKNYIDGYNYYPKDRDELKTIIREHYNKGI